MTIHDLPHEEIFEAANAQFEEEYEGLMKSHLHKWVGYMGVYRIGVSEEVRNGMTELRNLCKDVGLNPDRVLYRCLEPNALGPYEVGITLLEDFE